MRLCVVRLILKALLISFAVVSAQAEVANFDTCVNSLHALGGHSKENARKLCLPGLTQETLNCQTKRFLINFEDPWSAYSNCATNPEIVDLKMQKFYQGVYENIPKQLSNNEQKKTVCSITVNSEDEREAFRSELNPEKYNWVELLPKNPPGLEGRFIPRDDTWIKRACQQKLRCDILVISGHFASTFLGDSGFEVKLEDLTKYSCNSGCQDLFSSISQVYLFGCNTLATKTKDSRTIYQYREILVVDGVAPHQAQRIAARRYTPYAEPIQDEIRRVFPKAQQIFGYSGPGPTGKAIKGTLKKFLRSAYTSENQAPEAFMSSFKQTLGRGAHGMKVMSSLPREAVSCQQPQPILRDKKLMTFEGLKLYIDNYGMDLPLPAIDLVVEAAQKLIISETQKLELIKLVFEKFQSVGLLYRQRLLCPIVLTQHASLVEPALKCMENDSWL